MIYANGIYINMKPSELLKWRKQNGYSQITLGKALGVSTITVYRWEKAMREIPTFLHLALRCLELEGGEIRLRKKELPEADVKKILMKQFRPLGMKEEDITQELVAMKREELKAKELLRAYKSFKKGTKKKKERRVKK